MPVGQSSGSVEDPTAALAACDSTQALYTRLAAFLGQIHALPAILYLRTGDFLHPVAGFDCSRDVPALPVASLPSNERSGELPANQVPLTLRGEVVGLLAIFGRVADAAEALHRSCTIIALKLRQLTQEEALRRELHLANEQLAQLVSAGSLLQHLEIEVLLVKILETLLGTLRVPFGGVALRDPAQPQQVRCATWGLRQSTLTSLRLSGDATSLIDRVLTSGAVLSLGREELRTAHIEPALPSLHGLLALPLSARGRTQAVALLGGQHEFTPAQRRLAEMLSGFAAIALDNAMLVGAMVDSERLAQELSIARSVQEGMYPTRGLRQGGLSVEGSSRPCHETGGDYFTFLIHQTTATAMIADVSGHGLGAALFATMAHAIVQHQLRAGARIVPACQDLNQGLCFAQSGRFMTCAMVAVDLAAMQFTYVSAGHCPLLHLHAGTVRWLESSGLPLGIILDNELTLAGPYPLAPGDLLLLYTDGVTEATNPQGETFGDERLAATVLQGWRLDLGPSELMMLINAEVDAFCGDRPLSDDVTLVALRADRLASPV